MDSAVADRDKVADWVDVNELQIDPYPTFERIRREGPVMWVPSMNRHFITSYDAAVRVEDEPETFTAYEPPKNSTMLRTMRGRPMNRKDDPDHMVDRKEMIPQLKPRAIKNLWTEAFEKSSDRFLDELIDEGPGANFLSAFAGPYAADNLRQMLGFPNITHVDMKRWSRDLVDGIGNVTDDPEVWARAERTNDEIESAIEEVAPRLRSEPDGTILSGLLNSGLPLENVLANVKLTISGGMNEPQNVVAAATWALLMHPEQRAHVDDGSVSYLDVFDETLRWETPINMFPRTVTHDLEFFGAHLRAGDKVSVFTGAANHDPAVFERPEEFDLKRRKLPHFAFGRGTHICAGMWVAKAMVATVALPKIFRRFKGLAVSPERETVVRGWVFRGLEDLPLTWTSAVRSNEE